MTPDLLALLRDGGPMGLLIVVLWLLLRGELVTRSAHADVLEDRDYWRTMALRGTELAKDAVAEVKRR